MRQTEYIESLLDDLDDYIQDLGNLFENARSKLLEVLTEVANLEDVIIDLESERDELEAQVDTLENG